MVSIRWHNVADYALGAVFLLSPYLFGFSRTFFAHDVFTVLGIGLIGYSLLTDYRLSFVRAVPTGMHMTFDVVTGAFAILAPWIYGYNDLLTPVQSGVHWVLGMTLIAVAAFTDRKPATPVTVLPAEPAEAEDIRRRRHGRAA